METAPRESADPELRAIWPAIPAGIAATLLVAAAAVPYLVATWDQPHRGAILVLVVVAGAGTVPFLFVRREVVLSERLRDPFFMLWSAADVAIVASISALDGGVESPFTVLLFLTQAFASVFYPVRLVVAAACLNLAGLAAIAMFGDVREVTATLFVGAALIGTSLLCAWAAVNTAAQRRDLARASRSDPLTGCLNRRGFEEELRREVRRAERLGASFALVVVDLDDFKCVNDERGHAAGDALLCEIVAALAGVVRGMDAVGRLGGDEFALLFPDAGCADLPALASRVELAVSHLLPCSFGGACYPDDAITPDELMNHADQEMYRQKRLTVTAAAIDQALAVSSSRTTSIAGLSSRSPL